MKPRGWPTQLRQKMPAFGRDLEAPDWGAKIGRFSGQMVAPNGSGTQPAATPQNDPNLDSKAPQFLPIFLRFLWQPSFGLKPCVWKAARSVNPTAACRDLIEIWRSPIGQPKSVDSRAKCLPQTDLASSQPPRHKTTIFWIPKHFSLCSFSRGFCGSPVLSQKPALGSSFVAWPRYLRPRRVPTKTSVGRKRVAMSGPGKGTYVSLWSNQTHIPTSLLKSFYQSQWRSVT